MSKAKWQGLRLSALVLAALLCIGGFLAGGGSQSPAGGWRRIDARALQQRLDSGDLVRHEAQWYRPVE